MSDQNYPENPHPTGKEFNEHSEYDPGKLKDADRKEYELIRHQRDLETKKFDAESEHHRENRIEEEIVRLKEAAEKNLEPEDEPYLREKAAEMISKTDEARRKEIEAPFLQAQRELLDRALGKNRYPKRKR